MEVDDAAQTRVEARFLLCGDHVAFFDNENHGFLFSHLQGSAMKWQNQSRPTHATQHDLLQHRGQAWRLPAEPRSARREVGCVPGGPEPQVQGRAPPGKTHRQSQGKTRLPLPATNAWLQAHTPQPEFSYEQALAHGGPEAESAKVMADAEEADNELEFKRRSGDPVVYGQVVQLYHTASRQYVRTSSSITSRREPSHLKVDLSSETTRHSWFRFMPRY